MKPRKPYKQQEDRLLKQLSQAEKRRQLRIRAQIALESASFN